MSTSQMPIPPEVLNSLLQFVKAVTVSAEIITKAFGYFGSAMMNAQVSLSDLGTAIEKAHRKAKKREIYLRKYRRREEMRRKK